MEPTAMQGVAGVVMLVIAAGMVIAWQRYRTRSSERRMLGMLTRMGLDPTIITSGDIETIMKEVRSRCRQCAVEGHCERWLRGEETGDNSFCPNHRVFEILGRYSGVAS